MDAVKFIEERGRMCQSNGSCLKCPAYEIGCAVDVNNAERLVDAVEKWSKEHPIKTNREKLIEIFGDDVFWVGQSEDLKIESWLDAEYKEPEEK